MKLIIDISEKDLEFIKDLQFIGGLRCSTKTIQSNVINAIRNGIPYEEKPKLTDEQIEQITDLLENEWGYEGMREDIERILRG